MAGGVKTMIDEDEPTTTATTLHAIRFVLSDFQYDFQKGPSGWAEEGGKVTDLSAHTWSLWFRGRGIRYRRRQEARTRP